MDMQQLADRLSSVQKQQLLGILSSDSHKPFATPQPAQLLCQPMQGTTAAQLLAASQQQAAQYHQLTCSLLSYLTQLPVPVLLPLEYKVHDKLFNMATQLPEPCRLQMMHFVPILQHSPVGPYLDYMAGQVVTFIRNHTAPLPHYTWEAALQVLQDLQELLPLRGEVNYLQLCHKLMLAKTPDQLIIQLAYVKAQLNEWLKANAAPPPAAPAAAPAAAAALPAPKLALLAAAAAAEAGLSLMFPEPLPAPLSMASPVEGDARHFLLAWLHEPVAVQALAALARLDNLPFNNPDGTGSLLATLAYMLSLAVRCGMLGSPAHTASCSSAAPAVLCTCQECRAASRASGLDKLLTLLWTAEWFNGKRDRSCCMYALYDYFYTSTGADPQPDPQVAFILQACQQLRIAILHASNWRIWVEAAPLAAAAKARAAAGGGSLLAELQAAVQACWRQMEELQTAQPAAGAYLAVQQQPEAAAVPQAQYHHAAAQQQQQYRYTAAKQQQQYGHAAAQQQQQQYDQHAAAQQQQLSQPEAAGPAPQGCQQLAGISWAAAPHNMAVMLPEAPFGMACSTHSNSGCCFETGCSDGCSLWPSSSAALSNGFSPEPSSSPGDCHTDNTFSVEASNSGDCSSSGPSFAFSSSAFSFQGDSITAGGRALGFGRRGITGGGSTFVFGGGSTIGGSSTVGIEGRSITDGGSGFGTGAGSITGGGSGFGTGAGSITGGGSGFGTGAGSITVGGLTDGSIIGGGSGAGSTVAGSTTGGGSALGFSGDSIINVCGFGAGSITGGSSGAGIAAGSIITGGGSALGFGRRSTTGGLGAFGFGGGSTIIDGGSAFGVIGGHINRRGSAFGGGRANSIEQAASSIEEDSSSPGDSRASSLDGSNSPGDSRASSLDGSSSPGDSRAGSLDGSSSPGDSRTGSLVGSSSPGDSRAGSLVGSSSPGDSRAGSLVGSSSPGDSRVSSLDGSNSPGDSRASSLDGSSNNADGGEVSQGGLSASLANFSGNTSNSSNSSFWPMQQQQSLPAPAGGPVTPAEVSVAASCASSTRVSCDESGDGSGNGSSSTTYDAGVLGDGSNQEQQQQQQQQQAANKRLLRCIVGCVVRRLRKLLRARKMTS